MKHKIDITGEIRSNEEAEYLRWLGLDVTCPNDIKNIIGKAEPGEEIDVYINSTGGSVDAGSEIYSLLREAAASYDVKIYITGVALSAASVIACASYCEMAPTALMMLHCVSGRAEGNHHEMEKAAEMMQTADKAICSAYMAKTGMPEEEALSMMEQETWLTAEEAKEKGLVDAIMFENDQELQLVASHESFTLSEKTLAKIREIKDKETQLENREKELNEREKNAATLRLKAMQLGNKD